MSKTITERLDELREFLGSEVFLQGKGLSKDENIRIFCYDPAEEMTVRNFLELCAGGQNAEPRCVVCDLYAVFLRICGEKRILPSIPKMEERKGREFLLRELGKSAGAQEFAGRIRTALLPGKPLFLTGVGAVHPFMRVHALLNALQPLIGGVPTIVFYPGSFDGYRLQLFNRLQPNNYYRAFRAI